MLGVENGVAWTRVTNPADVGHDVAHLTGVELLGRLVPELEVADFVHLVDVVLVRPERYPHPGREHAVHYADARDRAAVAIEVGVEDQRAQRARLIPARRRDAAHDRLEQLRDVGPLFRRDPEDLPRLRPIPKHPGGPRARPA